MEFLQTQNSFTKLGKTHRSYKKVEYPLVSDRNFTLSEMFGVLIEEEGQALRGSFVINPDKEVVAYEIHQLGIGRAAKELFKKSKKLLNLYINMETKFVQQTGMTVEIR